MHSNWQFCFVHVCFGAVQAQKPFKITDLYLYSWYILEGTAYNYNIPFMSFSYNSTCHFDIMVRSAMLQTYLRRIYKENQECFHPKVYTVTHSQNS